MSEGLFANDLKFVHPPKALSEVVIPVANNKYLQCEIEIKALVGQSPAATQFQVFERKVVLPKYCNFWLSPSPAPTGIVSFQFSGSLKIQDWIKSKFLVSEEDLNKIKDGKFLFSSDTENLHIIQSDNGLKILTDTIDLSGEVIQDLCSFFGISELNSSAQFPQDFGKIKELLEKIEDFNTVRTQLTVNMAESCQNVKALIVRAEDARIQKNMTYFKQNLSSLHQFNGQLLGEYQIRANNHTELLNCLKALNQFIQRAGNLRCGQAKNKTIAKFREGVKARDLAMITQAICSGG